MSYAAAAGVDEEMEWNGSDVTPATPLESTYNSDFLQSPMEDCLKEQESLKRDWDELKKELEEEKNNNIKARSRWERERKQMKEKISELTDLKKMQQDDSRKKEEDLQRDLLKAKNEIKEEKENNKKAKIDWEDEKEQMKEEITELRELMKSRREGLQQTVDDEEEEEEESSKTPKIDWTREGMAMKEEITELRGFKKESLKKQEALERELCKAKKETEEEKENNKKAKSLWEHEKKTLNKNIELLKDVARTEGKLKAGTSSPQEKEKVRLTLTLKWSKPPPSKPKFPLESSLQTWFSSKNKPDCTVEKILKDGRAVITITPPPAVTELQELNGQTLTQKGKEGPTATILRISLSEPELDEQLSNAAIKLPASQPEPLQVKPGGSSSSISLAEENISCVVPVGCAWYINQIYKDDVRQIEKNNGVKIDSEVKVTFKAEKEDGDPNKAYSDFTNLVQKHMTEATAQVTLPLQSVDPQLWGSALKMLKKTESKLLLTLSSGQIILLGPRERQDAFSRCLNAVQQTGCVEDCDSPEEEASLTIKVTVKDPLVQTGITLEQSHWKQMKTQFDEKIERIKAKFEVNVHELGNDSKVCVKVVAKRSSGNTSMESHALRALLRLYQKAATSPVDQRSVKSLNGVREPEGASSGFGGNAQSAGSVYTGGATPADKDDNCPICLGPFTDKQPLKCKHEFCRACLQSSKETMGPICPVCRAVFGKVEGNQPAGQMNWTRQGSSLPGFSNCDTIKITYYIPGGKQTEKHPNPGKYYSALNRIAYLPGNKEGEEVLKLLKRAFDQKLTFTVGTSRTTGADNQLTWNDIHHKTSTHGGPMSYGYPDPDYLSRVKEELKAKGIF